MLLKCIFSASFLHLIKTLITCRTMQQLRVYFFKVKTLLYAYNVFTLRAVKAKCIMTRRTRDLENHVHCQSTFCFDKKKNCTSYFDSKISLRHCCSRQRTSSWTPVPWIQLDWALQWHFIGCVYKILRTENHGFETRFYRRASVYKEFSPERVFGSLGLLILRSMSLGKRSNRARAVTSFKLCLRSLLRL